MSGRVFIVTGANKGIGFETVKAICKSLKNENATVVLTSRCPKNGKEAIDRLSAEGLTAQLEQLDITDEKSRRQFVDTIKSKYGHVECLVNNAGFAFKQAATEPLALQAKVTCAINYYGTRDFTKEFAPLLAAGSRLVNVASVMGEISLGQMAEDRRHALMSKTATVEDIDKVVQDFIDACEAGKLDGWPGTAYGFSKAAVIALTAAWARLEDQKAVKEGTEATIVTCCCPGWCKTDMGGWEAPPLSAADGAEVVSSLALGASKEHHGKFVKKGAVLDLRE